MIELTRRYRFPAAHVLRSAALSDADNRRIYGKCATPHGHGHNYGLEVTVRGPVDARTGRILSLERLDEIVQREVLDRFGYRLLNEDPLFERAVPTAENIARALTRLLAGPVARQSRARVSRVRLVETRRNSFECEGEQ
ncbi:MAG: 6-carboxytetrahydropterin synthase [Deltaproteobacteria bacterium]|nr:MAG: 6-carboxytetrahydropterin synthase [Deltaproteobacteria bacterium]